MAKAMSEDNTERREIEARIVDEIDTMIQSNPSLARDSVIVLDGEGWHHGVVGIVASRVKEAFGKPAIVLSRDGDKAKGSGRSVEGFPLCDAIAACGDLLTHYGGHPMAAGLSLDTANIELFRKRINQFASEFSKMPYDTLRIDCKLNPAYLSLSAVDELKHLQPYGAGNPAPVFGFFNMTIDNIIPVGNQKHLRLLFSRAGASLTAMYFFTEPKDFPYQKGDVVDVAATLEINDYNDTKSVSVIIKDIKASAEDSEKILNANRAFETFVTGGALPQPVLRRLLPERSEFAAVYRFLRNQGEYAFAPETLPYRLGGKINFGRIRVILEAMKQLGLITYIEGMGTTRISLNPTGGKVSLESAPIIKALKEAIQ